MYVSVQCLFMTGKKEKKHQPVTLFKYVCFVKIIILILMTNLTLLEMYTSINLFKLKLNER